MFAEMKLVTIDGKEIRTDNPLRKGTRIHGGGIVTRTFSDAPTKAMCKGCYEDFYNGQGAKECWRFKDAVVCNKVGHSSLHVANGPDTIMTKTLTCWHGVSK